MNHYERNRKAVQQGLDRRKALRLEALQDAAQLEFINGVNAHSRTIQEERDAQEVERRLRKARKLAAARLKKRTANKEKVACSRVYDFLFLTVGPILVATIPFALYNTGAFPLWIAMILIALPCGFSIYKFITTYPAIIVNMLREAKKLTATPALKNK